MEIYTLLPRGKRLSHTYKYPNTPEWGVIHYLAKVHEASKEKILSEVPGATSGTLAKLGQKRIIVNEMRVSV